MRFADYLAPNAAGATAHRPLNFGLSHEISESRLEASQGRSNSNANLGLFS